MTNSITHNPCIHSARAGAAGVPFAQDLGRQVFYIELDEGTSFDKVGDQTRANQPDRCIYASLTEGAVDLGQDIIDVAKWAISFRFDSFTNTNTNCHVVVDSTESKFIRLKNNAKITDGVADYIFDGTGNTINVPYTDYNSGKNYMIWYSDGTNVHLVLNGIYKGYVTPGVKTFAVRYLLARFSSFTNKTDGNYFDFKIWDLSVFSQAEIQNEFLDVNNEPIVAPDHRYLMNEGVGSACLDSGKSIHLIHGLYYLGAITVSDELHSETIIAKLIQNDQDKVGFNRGWKTNGTSDWIDTGIVASEDMEFEIFGALRNQGAGLSASGIGSGGNNDELTIGTDGGDKHSIRYCDVSDKTILNDQMTHKYNYQIDGADMRLYIDDVLKSTITRTAGTPRQDVTINIGCREATPGVRAFFIDQDILYFKIWKSGVLVWNGVWQNDGSIKDLVSNTIYYNQDNNTLQIASAHYIPRASFISQVEEIHFFDSIDLIVGAIVSGSLADIQAKGGDSLILSETNATPAFDYIFNISHESIPEKVYFAGAYNGNIAHDVRFQAYNYNTASWDDLLVLVSGTNYDVSYSLGLDYYDAANEESKVRFIHNSAGNINHELNIDYLVVECYEDVQRVPDDIDIFESPLVYVDAVKYNAKPAEFICGKFNKTSSCLVVPVPVSCSFGLDAFTVAGFFYLDDVSGSKNLLGKGSASDNDYEYRLRVSGSDLYFACYSPTAGAYIGRQATGVLSAKTWYFVRAVYEGGITSDKIKIYLDTIQVDDSNFQSGAFVGMIDNAGPIDIGCYNSASEWFGGNLHSFGIWAGIKTDEEILAYNPDGLRMFIPDCVFGYDVGLFGNDATPSNVERSVADNQFYNILKGLELYRHDSDAVANPDTEVPFRIDGSKITPVIANYTKISDNKPIYASNVFGNNLTGSVDFAPYLSQQVGVNMMKSGRGSFEVGTEFWVAYGTNTIASSADYAKAGTKSLKITYVDDASGAYNILASSGDLSSSPTVGSWYMFTGWVLANAIGNNQRIRIYDGAAYSNHYISKANEWEFVRIIYQVQAGSPLINLGGLIAGNIIYIDNWDHFPISHPFKETGYKPFSIFNKLGYVGNPYNYNEFFEEEITHLSDYDPSNSYKWTAQTLIQNFLAFGTEEVRKSLFFKIGEDSVSSILNFFRNLGVYLDERTVAEMDVVASKGGWLDLYNLLSEFHFNSDTLVCYDFTRGDTIFPDTLDNAVKGLDWSLNRNHLSQGVVANRLGYVKNASGIYVRGDGNAFSKYFETQSNVPAPGTDDFTVFGWFNMNTGDPEGGMFGSGSVGNPSSTQNNIQADGRLRARPFGIASTNTTNSVAGSWKKFICVWDRSDKYTYYVDASKEIEEDISAYVATSISSGKWFLFSENSVGGYANGFCRACGVQLGAWDQIKRELFLNKF